MLKHIGGMGLARGLYALSQAVLLILLARDVGPEAFGIVAAFLAAHTFLFLLAGMNTPTFVTREIALGKPGIAARAIRINAATMGVAIVIALASSAALFREPPLLFAVAGNAIAVWSERVTENRLAVAYGQKKIQPSVTTLLIRSIAPLAIYMGLDAFGTEALVSFAVARITAGIASQLLGLVLIRLPQPDPAISMKGILKAQGPLATSTAMGALRTLDSVIVVGIAGPTVSGVYSAVSRVVSPFNTLAASITPILVPRAAVASATQVRRTLDIVLSGGVALSASTLVLLPFSETIVVLLFGPSFAGGGAVLVWALFRIGPVAAAPLLSSALQAKGYDRLAARNSIVTSVLALTAVTIGTLIGGATGAAAGFALVTLICMIALWALGRVALNRETALQS